MTARESTGTSPPGSAAVLAGLLDTGHCPGCGLLLVGPVCTGCGMDMSGPDGAQLWALSQQAAAVLQGREAVLHRLRSRAVDRAGQTAPESRSSPSPLSPSPLSPSARAKRPSLLARVGVQGVLVGLGALLLAVAGLVFLVFSWDRLSLGGRAVVIGAITAAALGGAAWLRPRLAETAEAIGALGVVLVLADAWAIRATGLFGADRMDGAGYAALAAAGCAAVLLGWGVVGRVRAGSVGAAVVGPAGPILIGVWLAPSGGSAPWLRAFCGGLLGAATLAAARRWTPQPWAAERFVLRAVAGAGLALASVLTLGLGGWPGSATGILALAVAVTVLQAGVDRRVARLRQGWSVATGVHLVAAAGAAVFALLDLVNRLGRSGLIDGFGRSDGFELARIWALGLVPAAGAGIAWAAVELAGRRRPLRALTHRGCAAAARAAALVATVPAAAVGVSTVIWVMAAPFPAWRVGATEPLAHALAQSAGGRADSGSPQPALAAALGLASVALLLALSKPHRWAPAVAVAAGLAVVVAPLSPRLPVIGVVGLLAVLAVVAATVGVRASGRHPWVRPAGLVTAAVAGVLAVLLGWTVPSLSVPVTLLGVAGLVLARRVVEIRVRPLLLGAGLLATAVTAGAGAGLLGARVADRITVAAVTGSLLAGLLAAVPIPALDGPPNASGAPRPSAMPGGRWERLAGVGTGLITGAVGLLVALLEDADSARFAVLLAALLLACAAGVAWPARSTSPTGSWLPMVLAVGLVPLAAATSAALAAVPAGAADDVRRAGLAAAATVAGCGLLLALAGVKVPGDGRRRPAELGAAATVVAVLLAVTVLARTAPDNRTGGVGDDWVWLVWLFVGVAVSADAVPADRRRLGWAGWVLLTRSTWLRLQVADVGLVEAYTVPPALVLLTVAAIRLRRDRSVDARRALWPGLSLALTPSMLAGAAGSPWRPAVMIGLAALAVGPGEWAGRRAGRRLGGMAVAAGLVSAAGAGSIRALAELWRGVGVTEVWTAPVALVLLAAGVRSLRRSPSARSWPTVGPGLAFLLLPSLVLAAPGEVVWRIVALASVGGAVVVAGALYRLQAAVLGGGVVLAAHALVQLGPWVIRTVVGQPRWMVLGLLGAVLLALGASYERRLRELRAIRLTIADLR